MPKKLVVLLFLATQLLTGCYDATDVKDMVIPLIAGFDYHGGRYVVLLNYPVVGNAQKKSDVLRYEGITPGQARIDQGNKSSRIVAVGDLKGFVIGKDLAARGTKDLFDMLFRFPTLSQKAMLIVMDGQAEDLFKLEPKQYQTVGHNVLDLMKNSPQNNFIPDEDLHHFKLNVFTEGFNPALPVIRIHNKERIEVAGAALFKKYQMVAMVNRDDMRPLTWLRGEIARGDIYFTIEDSNGQRHQLTFNGGNKRSVKTKMENGLPVFEVEVKLQGHVVESLETIQYAGKKENTRLAEAALAEQVQRQCEDFVSDLQHKYRVDAILLGKYARVYCPELVKQDWDEVFCKCKIRVKVKATINGTGELA